MGAEIAGVDRLADPDRGVVAGDISKPGEWQGLMAGSDLAVHAGAVVSNAVDAEETWQVNVLGTRHAVDAARDAGVERFVHFSSVRAFSDRHYPDGADERWPVRPDGNPYVDTKVAAEQVVLQAHAAGEIVATNRFSSMHHRFEDAIAFVSRSETLHPGEVLGSGTVGSRCGLERGRFLSDGDVVELEVEGIGVLRNRFDR
jgi:nucleoside-diphosphate-sugar epimerase